MRTIVAHPLLFSHSATCAAELTTPNITRNLSGPALTGPVVVGVNETISIWCSARARVAFTGSQLQELRDLFWRYSNGTRLPALTSGEPSDFHVYEERYGGSAGNSTWRSVLHFKRAQPSLTGNYTCVANYSQTLKSQIVQIRGG